MKEPTKTRERRHQNARNCYKTGTVPPMRKLFALGAVALPVAVLGLAACGDDDDGGSDTTEVQTITSEVTELSVVPVEETVVEGTTVESEVQVVETSTEESLVVETEAGVGTGG